MAFALSGQTLCISQVNVLPTLSLLLICMQQPWRCVTFRVKARPRAHAIHALVLEQVL